jgi:hypothetical protein
MASVLLNYAFLLCNLSTLNLNHCSKSLLLLLLIVKAENYSGILHHEKAPFWSFFFFNHYSKFKYEFVSLADLGLAF